MGKDNQESENVSDPDAYIVIGTEDINIADLGFFETLEEAKKHKFKKRGPAKSAKGKAEQETSFSSIIDAAIDSFSQYYNVTKIATSIPYAFAKVELSDGINKISSENECVFKSRKKSIYKVPSSKTESLSASISSATSHVKSLSVLPSAVLLSIVATFDAHLAAIARFVLVNQPLASIGKEKQVSVSDILSYDNFEQLKSNLIDEEIYALMMDSHGAQAGRLEKFFNIEFKEKFARWDEFIEIFERRNLVAHGEAVANARYIQSLKKNKVSSGFSGSLKLNEEIKINRMYLSKSLDVLMQFLIVVTWTKWVKSKKDEFRSAYAKANSICYELIKLNRYTLSSELLKIFISWENDSVVERDKRMMVINMANAIKLRGRQGDDYCQILDQYDWSAVSNDFLICVAAIRGETEKLCSLMSAFKDESEISRQDFREWPVFSPYFKDESYKLKFLEVFGEKFDVSG